MAKFRKKPVVIEAVQFDPNVKPWPKGVIAWPAEGPKPRDMSWGYIETLEGNHHVLAGDWIITGIKGEIYPCKPDIFEATYEPADEELARPDAGIFEAFYLDVIHFIQKRYAGMEVQEIVGKLEMTKLRLLLDSNNQTLREESQ